MLYKLRHSKAWGATVDTSKPMHIIRDGDAFSIKFASGDTFGYSSKELALQEFEEIQKLRGDLPMLKTVGSDMKAFIAEHKSAIYWIALMFLADHILFQGAFRERLHGLMNKLLGKVEAQIEGKAPVALVPEQKA